MQTPLYKAVSEYLDKNYSRMHMPGHKGMLPDFLSDAAKYDITEVRGADSLYECDGAIKECEELYSEIYGSKKSCISAGGSTLCIQAMLAMVAKENGSIVCGRNIHISAVNAMGLLGLTPFWVYPKSDAGKGLCGRISPDDIRTALKSCPNASAVYITSPDYFGVISDIRGIKEVCTEYDVPLIVDNAHGSHLNFLPQSLHPMSLGADICCDSLHKTMPVLTGGALLHIGNEKYLDCAKSAMSIFGSTSPSYLIMLSVDLNLQYINDNAVKDIWETIEFVGNMKKLANDRGFFLPEGVCDPTRLALGFCGLGYRKEEFLALLSEYNIEHEYISDNYCVLLPSAKNKPEELYAVEKMLSEIKRKSNLVILEEALPHAGERVMSIQKAIFSAKRSISVESAVGEVAAELVSRCPPGIPITVPGEKIDEKVKISLKKYGISNIFVL